MLGRESSLLFGHWQTTGTECVIVSIMDANVVILILGFLPYREAVGVGELVCREWMKVHRRARARNWDLMKIWTMTIHTHDRTCYKSVPGAARVDRMQMPYALSGRSSQFSWRAAVIRKAERPASIGR